MNMCHSEMAVHHLEMDACHPEMVQSIQKWMCIMQKWFGADRNDWEHAEMVRSRQKRLGA
jgi:hypothetical protein